MSYTRILLHIVFATKYRKQTLLENNQNLFAYINGISKSKGVHLVEINGTRDHLHLLVDIHPQTVVANFLRDLKCSTSKWLKGSSDYPFFEGWADGYGAFSVSHYNKEVCRNYIRKQKEHHRKQNSKVEFIKLIKTNECEYEEKYIV